MPIPLNDNKLLWSSWQYYLIIVYYIIAFIGIEYFDNPYLFVWFAYFLLPIMDEVFSRDLQNPSQQEVVQLRNQMQFQIPLYISLGVDWLFGLYSIIYLSSNSSRLTFMQILGTIITSGTLATSNFNVAHQLFHKDHFWDDFCGTMTMARNLYMHFRIEHIHGHHKNVATPKDPASSIENQSLYTFVPSSIIGTWKSSWAIQMRILKDQNQGFFSLKNKMLQYMIIQVILLATILKVLGFLALFYFLIIAAFSIVYLEDINYIEHYGLRRKQIAKGEYEQVNIHHSWNAPYRASNYLLFKLQRHSDHHENSYQQYQTLCSYDQSPTLPSGYSVCLILALIPSSWTKIMNQVLKDYKNGMKGSEIQQKFSKPILNFIYKVGAIITLMMVLRNQI